MDASSNNSNSLFEVYLRLRPSLNDATERFLEVDDPSEETHTHITIKPPVTDYRKRAVERFAFTKVFEENASQVDLFSGTHILPLVEGVLGPEGKTGRDGLLATLGVTGSGKSHTILGSKSQRGLLQMTLDILFKSIGDNLLHPHHITPELISIDVSEAQLHPAAAYLDSIYGDGLYSRDTSRAATPMMVSNTPNSPEHGEPHPQINKTQEKYTPKTIRPVFGLARISRSVAKMKLMHLKDFTNFSIYPMSPAPKRHAPQPAAFPQVPRLDNVNAAVDTNVDYAIIVSMYEVYNDRIFDLLTSAASTKASVKDLRRRPLLFKPTEYSPDRKVVAGLKKIVCGTLDEALKVLETGLHERRVAGTGSNAVSSRSHGFFCVEVKKRGRGNVSSWASSTLTIVDLAGSERARAANTTGSTLAEAGKINESLMYLGQCMQMQSDNATNPSSTAPTIPFRQSFRQCKLTELLFANSFATQPPAASHATRQTHHSSPQKAIMIVTADARGDFNATSQILRYSALAREVTVPRIPSVSSTILASVAANAQMPRSRPGTANSATHTPSPSGCWPASGTWETTSCGTSDDSTSELTAQLEVLQLQLHTEQHRRREAEASWARAEERLDAIEREVREECWTAFEAQLAAERARAREAWVAEMERGEELVDAKVECFAQLAGVEVYEDSDIEDDGGDEQDSQLGKGLSEGDGNGRSRIRELEAYVQELEIRLASAEREKGLRTPSRKVKSFKAKAWTLEGEGVENAVSP